MEPYGFKEFPEIKTLKLEQYKQLKADILTTNTIEELKKVVDSYNYTKTLDFKLLSDLLNTFYIDNVIEFKLDFFISLHTNIKYIKGEWEKINEHIKSILNKRLLLLLTTNENSKYNKKLKEPVKNTDIKKILLFAHGDYSTMFNESLSKLIGKLKTVLIDKGLVSNIIVYSYDVNDLILPDFTTKESLKSFTDKFGKFDSIIPINCFDSSFNYGAEAKSDWNKFVKTEFVDVINENIKPDGYIITVGADYYSTKTQPQSEFFKYYKGYEVEEIKEGWKGDNNIFLINLGKTNKQENNNAATKAKQEAENKAKQEADNKSKREVEVSTKKKGKRLKSVTIDLDAESTIHFIDYSINLV